MSTEEVEIVASALPADVAELERDEAIIAQGIDSFREVGAALVRIRDAKRFRIGGYKSFEAYCRERWGMTRTYAYRVIEAANMAEVVLPSGNETAEVAAPTHETQMRALAPLRDDPDKAKAVWSEAVQTAGGRQPTETELRKAVAVAVGNDPNYVLPKSDRGEGVHHPAPYSEAVLNAIAELVEGYAYVLDPFAGTGRIHTLADDNHQTAAVEIEPEWAAMDERTTVGDATKLRYADETFDAIATSPTYGNRLADSYDAKDPEARSSYAFDLGHELSKNNSGAMQWGTDYRRFHIKAWQEAVRVLRPGGRFVLVIKDHIRDDHWQDVAGWHADTLSALGLRINAIRPVVTRGINRGANFDRVPAELVIAFDKPEIEG